MIFNSLCLLLILMITAYMSTQGLLTALIALVTATFASILSMALMEPVGGLLSAWRLDYSRGLAVLGVFCLAFAVTRITADILIPKNIKLPTWLPQRAGGGAVGFFTAMVVVGTCIIGIELMPLPTSLMGYDRYPAESRMQADTPGVPRAMANTWLGAERYTLALWCGASRGLGGGGRFSAVHPDLSAEAYGYRNTVQFASNHVLPQSLLKVETAWASADSKDVQAAGIKLTESGKKMVMVRVAIGKGAKTEISSDSDDTYFRITPTEVRLITSKGRQYYPIGYLEHGRTFTSLALDVGQLVEDYSRGTVQEDWVFQINDDEVPQFIEVKQARAELAGVQEKPVPPLASGDYPQKAYQKERSTLTVTMTAKGGPISTAKVYVLRAAALQKDIINAVNPAYAHAREIRDAMQNNTGNWNKQGAPGVPPLSFFENVIRTGIDNIKNAPDTESVPWSRSIPLLLAEPLRSEGNQNLADLPQYVDDKLVPLFNSMPSGSAIIATGATDGSGSVTVENLPKGSYTVFATCKTEKSFYWWSADVTFEAKSTKSLAFNPDDAQQPKVELP